MLSEANMKYKDMKAVECQESSNMSWLLLSVWAALKSQDYNGVLDKNVPPTVSVLRHRLSKTHSRRHLTTPDHCEVAFYESRSKS